MIVQDRISTFNKRNGDLNGKIEEEVDVLVIGSGMGGLTTASLLCKHGIKTYLAEKNDTVGGYYSSFVKDNAIYDYAISYALSFDEKGPTRQLIDEIKLNERLEIIKLHNLDKYIFQNQNTYSMPSDFNEYIVYLQNEFPKEKDKIAEYFTWLKEFNEGLKTKRVGAFIIKNFLKDYEPFIKSYFTDQRLINILSMRIQADPSSLFIMGGFLNECLLNGMYYVKGGFGEFALSLAEFICENGGHVGLNKLVNKLEYDEIIGKYKIGLSSSETMTAKYIVSDTSPFNLIHMFNSGTSKFIAQVEKFEKISTRRKIGHSSISIYLKVKGVDLSKWDCGRIYIIPSELEEFDIFKYYQKIESGGYFTSPLLKVHIPSNYDDSICDVGESIIRVETDMCIDYFKGMDSNNNTIEKEKNRILDYVLDKLNQNLDSNISANVQYSRIITPVDFEHMMLNDKGSGTGWAHTVENYFKDIFSTKTVITNCYIVGQWGELGSGLRQLILTGRKAAEDIIKNEKR